MDTVVDVEAALGGAADAASVVDEALAEAAVSAAVEAVSSDPTG